MIISFSQLGNHGRLGNQLFQIASTMGLAEKHGAQAAFPEWEYERYFEVSSGLDTPRSAERGGATRPPQSIPHGEMQSHCIEEKYFYHHDWDITGDCDLLGYLQSEKYFGSTRLKLKEEFVAPYREILRSTQNDKKGWVCIHIRRGDYVGNNNYHHLSVNFYIDALMTHFPDWRDHKILFISDDIEYCRTHFECMPNAVFSDPTPSPSPNSSNLERGDIRDMALASCCDHFIISNSSFGWWCAWLGEKGLDTASPTRPPSKIIHCGCLHTGRLAGKGSQDYYPERWTRHEKENHKIPLKDVTFMIPVFFDHVNRKGNLELSLHLLQSAFDTNFIIMEQGSRKFGYMSQWAQYVRSEARVFHRTRMLNEMARMAETDYIVNWDADVLIPPMQILMAVEQLRSGADMVYPYDGRFARMPRNVWYPRLQKYRDIGLVGAEAFKGREIDNSVGGAVMFNKRAFIEGGMENENMVSFGPEDAERHDRFKSLGYDIRRVKGTLFHMNHFVGVNSSYRNPHFKANHRELEKVRGMSAEELRGYVSGWRWLKAMETQNEPQSGIEDR